MKPRKTTAPHLPIWRDAQRMLVWTEQAVRHFARYHKYTVGSQLRVQALAVCRLVIRAQATEASARFEVVAELHLAAEEMKLLLQMGKEIQAFRGWAEFEQGVQLALAIARQAAGWRRALAGRSGKAPATEREGAGALRAEVR
jgi:hypothetical protein